MIDVSVGCVWCSAAPMLVLCLVLDPPTHRLACDSVRADRGRTVAGFSAVLTVYVPHQTQPAREGHRETDERDNQTDPDTG